jgi:hypothetical protein
MGKFWFFHNLKKDFFEQGNRPDAIGFNLTESFSRPALECSDYVSVNRRKLRKNRGNVFFD